MPPSNVNAELVVALAGALLALNSQFQLLCGRCWKMYKGSTRGRPPFDEVNRLDAGRDFAEAGWHFDGTAICPHCAKQKEDTGVSYVRPNPSIERTAFRGLRRLTVAAHVESYGA
jgi:hypothetical protein